MNDTRIHILTSNVCNNNCIFCMEDRRIRERPQFSYEEIMEKISSIRPEKIQNILFTGNEPTLNPNLNLFIQYAKEQGFKNICLVTNGRMLSQRNYLESLIKSGLNQVNLSLHGSNANIHDAITRVPGSFRQALRGIKNILDYGDGIELNINSTITMLNLSDLEPLMDLCKYIKPKVHVLNPVIPLGRALDNISYIVPKYSDIRRELMKVAAEKASNILLNGLPRCVLQGMEYLTGRKETIVLPKKGHAIIMKPDHKKTKKDMCKVCKHFNYCEGVWKGYADHFGMQEFKPVVDNVGILNITPFCNQSCIFCSEGERTRDIKLPSKDHVLQFIDDLADRDIQILNFMGGETTLRPDLGNILKYVKDKGIRPFLTTNGSMLHDHGVLSNLRYLSLLDLSFHGWDRDSHRRITCNDNFDSLIVGIREFIRLYPKKPIIFKIVINSYNYRRLKDIILRIQELDPGIHFIHLKFVNIQGKTKENLSLVPRYSEVQPYIHQAIDHAESNKVGVFCSNVPLCLLGEYFYTSMEVYTSITQNDSYFLNKIDINQNIDISAQSNFDRSERTSNRVCECCHMRHMCDPPSQEYVFTYGLHELKSYGKILPDIERKVLVKSYFIELERLGDE